jgi:hypothetical protein
LGDSFGGLNARLTDFLERKERKHINEIKPERRKNWGLYTTVRRSKSMEKAGETGLGNHVSNSGAFRVSFSSTPQRRNCLPGASVEGNGT